MDEINTLYLDFEKGVVVLNGHKIATPMILIAPQGDKHRKSRVINNEKMPEATIEKQQIPLTPTLEICLYDSSL